VAVLGQMNELGETSTADHIEVGCAVGEARPDLLITVGNQDAAQLGVTAAEAGIDTVHAADKDAAAELIAERIKPGDVVLFKASNGVGLMSVAARLASGTA
jgi:UDP-N-acetylmuramoyl-tripeptide--D-alanyl-D-alanine ligase